MSRSFTPFSRPSLVSCPSPLLSKRGQTPKYDNIGVHQEGSGGLWEHAYHQGYNPDSIIAKVESMTPGAGEGKRGRESF